MVSVLTSSTVDHSIYPNELEVKNTTDTQKFASYLEIDNGRRLKTKHYDKLDDFTSNCQLPLHQ